MVLQYRIKLQSVDTCRTKQRKIARTSSRTSTEDNPRYATTRSTINITRQHCSPRHSQGLATHLALASLTRILGRARSSLSLWLCSVNRLSFNSDIDCLCGREFIVGSARGRLGD